MMKRIMAVMVFLAVLPPGYCWNNTGHMVTAAGGRGSFCDGDVDNEPVL
jgi:hypothetical protein